MKSEYFLKAKSIRVLVFIILMIPSLGSLSGAPGNGPIYVDVDAPGGQTGDSWQHAYKHLQDALDEANSAPGITNYEIWVAEGVYYPDLGTGRLNNVQTYSFDILYDNVKMYGGFAGFEDSRDQRDWELHPTILSGDIDENDTHGGDYIADYWGEIYGNNAYHVVVLDGVTNEAITQETVIDGFIITAGDADPANEYGGGIYCQAAYISSSGGCSPTLRDLIIQGNRADYGGGVELYAHNSGISSPYLTNVSFLGNYATNNGGGMYISVATGVAAESIPRLVNARFRGNYAGGNGGGLGVLATPGTGSPILTNVEFYDNGAANYGGGMYTSASALGTAAPNLTNVTFSGNSADKGGGMYNYRDLITGVFGMNLQNTIIWGNSATTASPTMHNNNAIPVIASSDIQGCGGSTSWGSYYGTDMGGNIDLDPLFASLGDLTLQSLSPAIDAGDQMLLPADVTDLDGDLNTSETIEYDLAMKDRVEGVNVDMGAYEAAGSGDTIGFYSRGQKTWYLKDANDDGWGNVTTVRFGSTDSSWIPVVGDWDGDGTDTMAMYSRTQKTWYLKDTNTDGWGDVTTVRFGSTDTSWIPVAGDWNGDGTDTMAMYSQTQKTWYLKGANDDGWGNVTTVRFGSTDSSWIPVAGDWNGNGTDTMAMYSQTQKTWYLKDGNIDGWGDVTTVRFGSTDSSWIPAAGDWNGNGTDTMAIYSRSQKTWYLKDANIDGWGDVTTVRFGSTDSSWVPVTGKW